MNGRSLASLPDVPPGHRLVPRHCHPTLPSGRVVIFRVSSEIQSARRFASDLVGLLHRSLSCLTRRGRTCSIGFVH